VNWWFVVAVPGFRSRSEAQKALDALGDLLGGLQCRPVAGKDGGVILFTDNKVSTFTATIETGPEVASFASGFLSGWLERVNAEAK